MELNYWNASKAAREAAAKYAAALWNRDAAEDILRRYTAWYEDISVQELEASLEVIEAKYEALQAKADRARELAEGLRAVWQAADKLEDTLLDLEGLEEYWEGRA